MKTADDLPVFEFMECDTCRAKLGSPTLCEGCLRNRVNISSLKRRHKLYAKERALELVQTLGMDDWSIMARLEELSQLAKHNT